MGVEGGPSAIGFFSSALLPGRIKTNITTHAFPASPLATSAPYIQSEMLFSKELLQMIFLNSAFFFLIYCIAQPFLLMEEGGGGKGEGEEEAEELK